MRLKYNKNKNVLGNMFINHFPGHQVTVYWTVTVTLQCICSGLSQNYIHAAHICFTSISLLLAGLCKLKKYRNSHALSVLTNLFSFLYI